MSYKKPRIVKDKCIACGNCSFNCPVDAIEAVGLYEYQVDFEKCIGCLMCYRICDSMAIELIEISND